MNMAELKGLPDMRRFFQLHRITGSLREMRDERRKNVRGSVPFFKKT